jgi:predicted small secreted protein
MSKKQIGKKTIAPALVAMLMVFALLLSACNSDTGGGA